MNSSNAQITMHDDAPHTNRYLPLAIALALGLSTALGGSDTESQKLLSDAGGKSPFVAKAPPEPAPPVAKAAAPAANAAPAAEAAPAANAAPAQAPPAVANPAAAPAANNVAANPAAPAAAPAGNPPAAAAPAEGGGFFSNLAKGVSDRIKKPADKPAAQPASSDPASTVKAGVGVGKKGRGYGGGIIAAAVHAKFSAEERIIFEAQIPQAMQLFKAQNENTAPKTHEQFMKEIIEANFITLPELPPGDKYKYDPKAEELMVEQMP